MFDFFRKKKLLHLPTNYAQLINQTDYNLIVGFCTKYLDNAGQKIVTIGEGEFVVDFNGQEKHYYLDNLVRILAQNNKREWEKLVIEHFDKNQQIPFAIEYLYKDFEYASQFIKTYIKSIAGFNPDVISDSLYRVDLPETYTFLILDFNEQFHYINKKDIQEWNKTEKELFEIGFSNISLEKIEIEERLIEDKYPVFTFFSGDFSATYIIELEKNASFSIGTHGSVVSIPAKGSAFVHPIENSEVMNVIGILSETVQKFFDEDPGNINTQYYWFHDGKFDLFPTEPAEEGYLSIECPIELKIKLGIV